MAPLPESRKRPGSSLGENEHHLKRQKRHYHHDHTTRIKQSSAIAHVLNDPEGISNQLRRSIALVLHAVGFSDATPEALNSFTLATEEYMDHLLSYVSVSMESAKRSQAIPFDFEYALNANHLTLRSLLPHLNPPTLKKHVANSKLVAPAIDVEDLTVNKDEILIERFSIGLRGPQTQTTLAYAPRRLPTLPGRHTYKSTPAVTDRANDAKSIRERATEESRLGEEALRRLVSGAHDKGKTSPSTSSRGNPQSAFQKLWETLEEEADDDQDRLELKRTHFSGPPINAEDRYWRKPIRPTKKVLSTEGKEPG